MGGISDARGTIGVRDGRPCLHLSGSVRLENNGGFVQAALPLSAHGGVLDASAYGGVEFLARSGGGRYFVHLRTSDCRRPWEYYGAPIDPPAVWTAIRLPFAAFQGERVTAPLDPSRLLRIGFVGAKAAFSADLEVATLYLSPP